MTKKQEREDKIKEISKAISELTQMQLDIDYSDVICRMKLAYEEMINNFNNENHPNRDDWEKIKEALNALEESMDNLNIEYNSNFKMFYINPAMIKPRANFHNKREREQVLRDIVDQFEDISDAVEDIDQMIEDLTEDLNNVIANTELITMLDQAKEDAQEQLEELEEITRANDLEEYRTLCETLNFLDGYAAKKTK